MGLWLTLKPVRRHREQMKVSGSEGVPREISGQGRGWNRRIKLDLRVSRKAEARRGANINSAVS